MQIIELNETQFNNYAKIHSRRNYFQSVEYTKLFNNKVLYLGLIDESNNLYGATSLIINELKMNYKYAYAGRGFLINYNNLELLTSFTNELKKYLKKLNIIFIKLDPNIEYKIWDKNNKLVYHNKDLINNLSSLGYTHLGFNEYFEANHSRYEVILNQNNIEQAYENLSRNVKRSIKDSSTMGISIHKGDINNLDLFYSLIRKKTNYPIEYYRNYFKHFNGNYTCELYFAKINPRIYMDNYRYLLDKEFIINTDINNKVQSTKYKNTNKIINNKISSDRKLEIYNKHVINSTNIYREFPNGLVIGTCMIIKNDREINFIIDGYEEKLRNIYSSYLLKWEIIKKYLSLGYTIFNLGEVTGNRSKENNKYYGLYFNKIALGGNLIEYPGEFDLIINKPIYNLFYNIMHYSSKIKEK